VRTGRSVVHASKTDAVTDIVFILVTMAAFALLVLIAKAADRL
jgi:preprotein translocase subunit SecE